MIVGLAKQGQQVQLPALDFTRKELTIHGWIYGLGDGMLRDLRITIDEVESRLGGEEIVLLGELSVDRHLLTRPHAQQVAHLDRIGHGRGR